MLFFLEPYLHGGKKNNVRNEVVGEYGRLLLFLMRSSCMCSG